MEISESCEKCEIDQVHLSKWNCANDGVVILMYLYTFFAACFARSSALKLNFGHFLPLFSTDDYLICK